MASLLDVRTPRPTASPACRRLAGRRRRGVKAVKAAVAAGSAGASASATPLLPPRMAGMASQLGEVAAEWSKADPPPPPPRAAPQPRAWRRRPSRHPAARRRWRRWRSRRLRRRRWACIVAFGARNLLHADDRKRFLAAAADRDKLLQLIRDNMAAVGVGGDSDVAAMTEVRADAGLAEFDPLELLNDGELPRRRC
jgi:hypothetical protein